MDATSLTIVIPGPPSPQPRPRFSRKMGKPYYKDNGIVAYRASIVIRATIEARQTGWQRQTGPMGIVVRFAILRPPSHFRADGSVRPSAAMFPPKRAGDWDNLAKGVCDALTDSGVIWVDDDQIVDAHVLRRYAWPGEKPSTTVTVRGAADEI
jgi:Holliday junction resolvase RusA-like endonuclease